MKKQLKTYGVPLKMDYIITIRIGGVIPRTIHFSGGSITLCGMRSATYSTSDIMEQITIESLPEFHNGIIRIEDCRELNEEVEVARNPEASVADATPESDAQEPVEESPSPAVEESEDVASDATEVADAEEVRVAFHTNQEAKDFLVDKYGVMPSKIRSREEIIATAKSYGVDIIFE